MTARRSIHALPGDAEHGPAPSAAWTVGTLRAALVGIPDDTLIIISAEDFEDPDFVTEQVITSAEPAGGNASDRDRAFGLNCEIPDGPIELRGSRARALTAHELLASRELAGPCREPSLRPDRELEAEL